jgi:hypothetical protein
MITLEQYFGPWGACDDITEERRANAAELLHACAALEYFALRDGVEFPDNPHTGSGVSGQTYGGFRPQNCTQGAPHSAHKDAIAVDRYDPDGKIDEWCMSNLMTLASCGIYIEHPDATPGWSHWSIKKPGSGNRVFRP